MKLNSPESIKTAEKVFRLYRGSWAEARAAARRDQKDGVLVIPPKGHAASERARRVAQPAL